MIIGIDGNEANIENRVGVNQYAAELLSALEKLPEEKKHKFIIYLSSDPLPHLPKEREGWKYKVLYGRGLWVLRLLMPYLWLARDKPDVFFTPSHYAPPFLPMPIVISIMDLGYLSSIEQFKKSDFYQLKYWGVWSIRGAQKIIAISDSTKKDIERYYPWTQGKVEVTHLAYDKERFHWPVPSFQVETVKKKYGIKGDYILFLSTLKPSKNVEGIVEAYKMVCDRIGMKLVIAGKKGWLYESIFKKVQELGLADQVVFTDFVSEEDKGPLVAGAKAFLAPSFWEGFGIHVLEAMAVGVPVVVSGTGSLPEVVGEAGAIVDPYNHKSIAKGIEEAISRHDYYSKKGLIQAKKFSWEKTASKTLKILESLA